MKKGTVLAASALSVASAILPMAGVFAASNYGIEYSGGEPLSASNVTIDPDLIDGLTELINASNDSVTVSNSSKWLDGYILDGQACKPYKYFKISNNDIINADSGLSFTTVKGKYTEEVKINNASLEGYVDDGKAHAAGVIPQDKTGFIYGMSSVYTDAECANPASDMKAANGAKLFIKVNTKLTNNETGKVVNSDALYFGIIDIDAAQSFKILTQGNELSKDNMFARSAEDLQGNPGESRNMFVADGHYIYSEIPGVSTENSNIYVKLGDKAQEDGLDIVFGFTGWAASATKYLAKEYEVAYKSDANGEITGITDETVLSGENPAGTTESAKDGYSFVHWVADQDVTLADGTTIKAGEAISAEQIALVVVDQDITFLAVHEEESAIGVPDTGAFTGAINTAAAVSVSIIGVLALALAIRSLPHLTHKKVKFD